MGVKSNQELKPFRVAFIGIDHPHGAGWRDLLLHLDATVNAIVPGYDNGTASLEERYAHVPRFQTVDELIEQGDFEGAIVCLPNDTGPQAVAKLASAGKHVLVEKPAAGSAQEARQFVEAVETSGVAFQNGYMWRYDEGANRLRDMLADGRFGKVISLETTFVTSDVRRRGPKHYLFDREVSGAGFFNWLACHFLDLIRYVTGQAIVGVTARTGVFGATAAEVEDGGIAILDLEGGGVATFIGGYWLPRWAGESHWCLRGSERWVHWSPTSGKLEIHGPQPQWYAMEEVFQIEEQDVKGYGGIRGVQLIRDWIEAARSGARPCRNTARSTLATLELIDTIYQSSQEGRRIECNIGA